MKYLLLLFVLFSCRPEPMATPAPDFNPTFVPIWRNDTMVNAYRKGVDTFYSFIAGDTSGVVYGGDTLYIFGIFDTTKSSSMTAWIGAIPMDTAAAYSKCIVSYYRYYSTSTHTSKYASQTIGIVSRYPHFNVIDDAYYIGR